MHEQQEAPINGVPRAILPSYNTATASSGHTFSERPSFVIKLSDEVTSVFQRRADQIVAKLNNKRRLIEYTLEHEFHSTLMVKLYATQGRISVLFGLFYVPKDVYRVGSVTVLNLEQFNQNILEYIRRLYRATIGEVPSCVTCGNVFYEVA